MKFKEISILILSPILGFLAFIIPELFGTGIDMKSISFLAIIADVYESVIFIPTLIMLFSIGIILGYIRPKLWIYSGLLTITIFPLASLFEIINSPTSNNLWPLEFVIYCVLAIPAILGAYIGNRTKIKKSAG